MILDSIPQPITIVGIPRSGTSLVASLFAAHGVWTGPCRPADEKNPRGYFESIAFNRIWGEWWSDWWSIGRLIPDPKPGFKDRLLWALIDDGYRGGPWLVKHDILCFPIWAEFEPRWICVRRDPEAIAQSLRAFFAPEPERADFAIKRIALYEELLDHLVALGGKELRMEHLIHCDCDRWICSLTEDAFSYCGIEPDDEKIRSIIDPALEHWR